MKIINTRPTALSNFIKLKNRVSIKMWNSQTPFRGPPLYMPIYTIDLLFHIHLCTYPHINYTFVISCSHRVNCIIYVSIMVLTSCLYRILYNWEKLHPKKRNFIFIIIFHLCNLALYFWHMKNSAVYDSAIRFSIHHFT